MCGRFLVAGDYDPREQLGINTTDFNFQHQSELAPGQQVTALCQHQGQIDWLTMGWGIQPQWSAKLIINAREETARYKPTFAGAFAQQRCLIPCKGWYEWRQERQPGLRIKQKYRFTAHDDAWILMAGLWFKQQDSRAMVILTTAADPQCVQYHHRMPWLLQPSQAKAWLSGAEMSKAILAHSEGKRDRPSRLPLTITPIHETKRGSPSSQQDLFNSL